ncbi:hypothetical protein SNE26_09485 [Mucilaginibacter sp. cycad4]|uniref:hypothetical protein n=1 Tax=Mucilaginibacter sp. cycad4 TaxID=3342096 RepID=UPI002AABC585|nr:hypothetical protein [Mucilaginibacter gossypii]WPV02006.1 hypothetical protein SNE26_09485 [Mucilaginibacter gossypii]
MSIHRFNLILACLIFGLSISLQAQSNLVKYSEELANKFVVKDTLFKKPYIDIDEWRNVPVRHRYVHGGFKGTSARFSFYFPSKEQYQGHFFQYITPFPDSENGSQGRTGEEDKIGFCVSHGAYFVETNEGGNFSFTNPNQSDPSLAAYRVNAATAQFSRSVAEKIYDGKRPYGYAFGGSGGAYRTVGGFESTDGVWEGIVPYVMGSDEAIPNVFTVRMFAMRVLRNKFAQIVDALEPGGSGNVFAGLNDEETAALTEVTRMGFPLRSWFGYKTMDIQGFPVLYQAIVGIDKAYFDHDFWNLPGYLGHDSPASVIKDRIQQPNVIKAPINMEQAVSLGLKKPISTADRGTAGNASKTIGGVPGGMPVAFQLQDMLNDVYFLGGDLIIKSGAAAGKVLLITKIENDKVVLGPVDESILTKIKPGDSVQVDNSNFLAIQTYHRHQVPGKEYYVWDHFRNADGTPKYPQRPFLLGPLFTRATAGLLPTGKFKGKMILLESAWDREAFPWQADWYRTKVKANLGDSLDNHFRVWFTDRALHGDVAIEDDPTETVSYLGVLQQALLDLSAWVEKSIAPAPSTNYKIVDGQVVLPPAANERKGIQPVVFVKANGGTRSEVRVGQTVTFTAVIDVPEHAGKVVTAVWNFEGLPKGFEQRISEFHGWNFVTSGLFPVAAKWKAIGKNGSRVKLTTTYKFSKPGTYFPTLRVASQRQGDINTPFARIQNLGKVRVIVK